MWDVGKLNVRPRPLFMMHEVEKTSPGRTIVSQVDAAGDADAVDDEDDGAALTRLVMMRRGV